MLCCRRKLSPRNWCRRRCCHSKFSASVGLLRFSRAIGLSFSHRAASVCHLLSLLFISNTPNVYHIIYCLPLCQRRGRIKEGEVVKNLPLVLGVGGKGVKTPLVPLYKRGKLGRVISSPFLKGRYRGFLLSLQYPSIDILWYDYL
jgi:hypothetical protein